MCKHRRFAGEVPTIGDNVYICTGAKIVGDVAIADNVIVGANALVNKSILQPGVTVGGIPAKIISEHGLSNYLNARLFL